MNVVNELGIDRDRSRRPDFAFLTSYGKTLLLIGTTRGSACATSPSV